MPKYKLSQNLQPIYDYELALGNEVIREDEDMWSNCPLAIVFKQPLHFDQIASNLTLPKEVRRWKNLDGHYDLEEGFSCQTTGHSLAGPIAQDQ